MSMIDTFAATGAGAFSLSENGLYTVEGWRIFLSALGPSGLFGLSRWHGSSAPIEIGRSISLASAALLSLGVENPRSHIFVATVSNLATLIVSKQSLSAADVDVLSQAAERLKFDILVTPNAVSKEPAFADLLSAKSIDELNRIAKRYWLDMSPPTDARPVFFNQLPALGPQTIRRLLEMYRTSGTFVGGENLVVVGNMTAFGTLILLILLSFAAVILTIIMPARSAISKVDRGLAVLGSGYFLLIGLGFMFVEIGLVQRISVFMGHPIYALGVVLFSIILSTGLGSFLSERLPLRDEKGALLWAILLATYLVAIPAFLPSVVGTLESSDMLTRSLTSVALIAPAGLLMGYGFPTGMALIGNIDETPTPWFWGVNGAGGVLAAGLAVASSIMFSIDTTIRVGAVCYLLLLPIMIGLMRMRPATAPPHPVALTQQSPASKTARTW